jgi:hypothetical protein
VELTGPSRWWASGWRSRSGYGGWGDLIVRCWRRDRCRLRTKEIPTMKAMRTGQASGHQWIREAADTSDSHLLMYRTTFTFGFHSFRALACGQTFPLFLSAVSGFKEITAPLAVKDSRRNQPSAGTVMAAFSVRSLPIIHRCPAHPNISLEAGFEFGLGHFFASNRAFYC